MQLIDGNTYIIDESFNNGGDVILISHQKHNCIVKDPITNSEWQTMTYRLSEKKNRMNPEIKKHWIAALRSGEYKQGLGRLQKNDKFCCLGVLCDLHMKLNPELKTYWVDDSVGKSYLGEDAVLPNPVAEWAGLDPYGSYGTERGEFLTNQNDEGVSFSELADIIEQKI